MQRLTTLTVGLAAAALTAVSFAPGASAARGADFETSASSQAPASARAFGITSDGELVAFRLANPQSVNSYGALTGWAEGDTESIGADVRPSNGRLYVVGDGGGVYTVALRTGALTQVGQISVPLDGQRFGVDFNPAADALRIVSDAGQNLRLAFTDSGVTTNVDTPLTSPPTAGTTSGVTAAAYTNNDNSTVTGTTLLDINTATNGVVVQAPANAGTLSSVGSLRKGVGPDASFDIYSAVDGEGVTSDNAGYAILMQNGNRILHQVNLTTGEATRVGRFPTDVADLAIRLAPGTR
ncbi:DUF4394 domain-containing protein [Nocardioides lentus]|uniref:DUF4394 domain-containing protein n=1 Tax=Nocardioides lentus TaxID=338077 RepID=A0ABN2PKB3_9ACTN